MRERTAQLKHEFQKIVSSEAAANDSMQESVLESQSRVEDTVPQSAMSQLMDEEEEETQQQLKEINLTNQLIGEVQGFIFIMRWAIYEFYNFKQLEKEHLLLRQDFTAIDDDMVMILHKTTVKGQVFPILLILSRMLNYKQDKSIRKAYKLLDKNHTPYYPLENKPKGADQLRIATNPSQENKALAEIVRLCSTGRQNPFKKAIDKFREIMGSDSLTPLDRLYKLQYLPLTDGLDKNKDFVQRFGPLTRDEKTPIFTYIIIQARVIDLSSKIDLITAFSTEYMQESEDGCQISETYLNLIASFLIIKNVEVDGLG